MEAPEERGRSYIIVVVGHVVSQVLSSRWRGKLVVPEMASLFLQYQILSAEEISALMLIRERQ